MESGIRVLKGDCLGNGTQFRMPRKHWNAKRKILSGFVFSSIILCISDLDEGDKKLLQNFQIDIQR
jgi:hypothetical protein